MVMNYKRYFLPWHFLQMKQHKVEKQMKQRVFFEMQSCQKQSHVICCTDCKLRQNVLSKDSDYQNQDMWLVKACKRREKL